MRIKRKGYLWSQVPFGLITSSRVSAEAVRLFAYLDFRAGDGVATVLISTMARELHCNKRSVRRHLQELITLGVVVVTERPGRSSIYELDHERASRLAEEEEAQENANQSNDESAEQDEQDESEETISSFAEATQADAIASAPACAGKNSLSKKKTSPPSSSELIPVTREERALFGRLQENARAHGRRGPARFQSVEQARAFREAAKSLNGRTEIVVEKALSLGITSLPRVIAYLSKVAKEPQQQNEKTGRTAQIVTLDEL